MTALATPQQAWQSAPKFGVVRGESPLYASACLALAERALSFILTDDLVGPYSNLRIDAFQSALRAHFVDGLEGGGIFMDAKQYKLMQSGRTQRDFAIMAWRSLVKTQFDWAERLRLERVIPALGSWISKEEESAIANEFGGQLLTNGEGDGCDLKHAWAVCKANVARAQARICMARALQSAILWSGNHRDKKSTADEQLDALVDKLYAQKANVSVDMFSVGVMLGGEAVDELKAMAKSMFTKPMSVMQLVSRDGIPPSSYPVASEDALRKAIASA